MKCLAVVAALALVLVAVPTFAGNLQVSETLIDYGTVKEGPPVVKRLILTNAGDASLEISNVASS